LAGFRNKPFDSESPEKNRKPAADCLKAVFMFGNKKRSGNINRTPYRQIQAPDVAGKKNAANNEA
jgi:hypothetical protein